MSKRISQETFDEAVKENMEDFDMEEEEAVADAIKQFEMQGVDLSNIDKRVGRGKEETHPALDMISKLRAKGLERGRRISPTESQTGESGGGGGGGGGGDENDSESEWAKEGDKEVVDWLQQLESMAQETPEMKALIGSNGGVPAVEGIILGNNPAEDEIKAGLSALQTLCSKNEDNRRAVSQVFIDHVVELVSQQHETALEPALKLCATLMYKHERMKAAMMVGKAHNTIAKVLAGPPHVPEVRWALAAVRGLTTDDDKKAQMSKAFEYARTLAGEGIQDLIARLIRWPVESGASAEDSDEKEAEGAGAGAGAGDQTPTTPGSHKQLVEALLAGKSLMVNDEICKKFAEAGHLEPVVSCLYAAPFKDHPGVVKGSLGLLRALANSDDLKRIICGTRVVTEAAEEDSASPFAPIQAVVEAITRHKDQPDVLEQGIGCTAVVCLRAPEHAEKLAEMGIIPIIAQAMKQHPMAVGVQRQSCLAVRNLVSRKKELIDQMLASSVELFLEEAYNKFPKCKDVAYAAMRDMGLL